MDLPHPLTSAQWLIENMEAPDVRVVDASWFAPFANPPETGREAYRKAHIPGAVYFDIDEIADPDSDLAHTFPPSHIFSSHVRKLGLGDGHRLVVYDRNAFFASARVWWMFRAMGISDVLVLDGGLDAWIEAGGKTSDLPPAPTERHLTPRVRSDLIKTKAQMARLVETQGTTIIDARPAGRFSGTEAEPRKGLASGHMPGSINIPGADLITAGRMKPPAQLRTVFEAAGVNPKATIVTSCGSGVTAALTALALATLGNEHAAVYDGSWTEWASDGSLPVATGQST